MKAWRIVAVILVSVAAVGTAVYYARESSIIGTPSLCRDPNNINSHIYNPARPQTVKDCLTVSGIVDNVITEDAGDYHVWFHVDSHSPTCQTV